MKCRFCYTGNSASWFQDRDEMVKHEEYGKLFQEKIGPWKDIVDIPPAYILPFVQSLKSMRIIEIKGGEPFMSAGHIPLLKMLVDTSRAGDLDINYTTNGTRISDEVLSLWREFRQINLTFSVDGLGEVYKYVRGGRHSFEGNVLPNIRRVVELGMPNIRLQIHYTLCAYNLAALPDFLDWFIESELPSKLSFGTAEHPPFLSMRVLPKKLIDDCCQRLSNYNIDGIADLIRGLQAIPNTGLSDLRRQFYAYTEGLDRLRGQKLEISIPYLSEFYRSLAPNVDEVRNEREGEKFNIIAPHQLA